MQFTTATKLLFSLLTLSRSTMSQKTLWLSEPQLAAWNSLKNDIDKDLQQNQPFQDCGNEINSAYNLCVEIYKGGFSQEFLKAMNYLTGVTGDIPELDTFRKRFVNLTSVFQQSYDEQIKAFEASLKPTVSPDSTEPVELPTTVDKGEPQATDDAFAYGVASGAETLSFAGLSLFAVIGAALF